MQRGNVAALHVILSLVAMLSLPACLLVVSTSPTPVSGATIVFVAIDNGGSLVASLHVSVVGVDGAWRDEGQTAADGTFRCTPGAGVTRVRAGVVLPSGYALAGEDRWPREIGVPSGASLQIEIRVKAITSPP